MLSKYSVIWIIILSFLFSCKEKKIIQLRSAYTGFHAETKWTYYFFTDNDYHLKYEGHIGYDINKGRYFICDSTVVLLNDTEHFEGFESKRLKIINNNCLRDFWNNYYCETQKNYAKIYEEKFHETLSNIDTIENFHLFKKARIELSKNDSLINPHLTFEGIKIINKEEAFEYTLKSWLPEYRRYQVHARVYVKPDPIRFYDIKDGKLINISNK